VPAQFKRYAQHPWSKEDIAKLKALHGEGKTPNEIGEIIGRSANMVRNKIRRYRLPYVVKCIRWTAEEDALLVEYRKDGYESKEIAELMGRPLYSIVKRVAKLLPVPSLEEKYLPHINTPYDPYIVAAALGTNRKNLNRAARVLRSLGHTVGKAIYKKKEITDETYAEHLCREHTIPNVATVLGVTLAAVERAKVRLKRRGFPVYQLKSGPSGGGDRGKVEHHTRLLVQGSRTEAEPRSLLSENEQFAY
jgi:transposase